MAKKQDVLFGKKKHCKNYYYIQFLPTFAGWKIIAKSQLKKQACITNITKETTIIYNLSECKFLYNGLQYLPDRLNSAFWPRWLAGLEMISKYYSLSIQRDKLALTIKFLTIFGMWTEMNLLFWFLCGIYKNNYLPQCE